MAFNILCWTRNALMEKVLAASVDDSPFDLKALNASDYTDANIGSLNKVNAKVIINFLPEDQTLWTQQYLAETRLLARFALENSIPIIQISSYLVFGDKPLDEPLEESYELPINCEKNTFLYELESIFQPIERSLVIRTSWLLNACKMSIFSRFSQLLLSNESSRASDHNFGSPVSIKYVTNCILAIVKQILCDAQNWGVLHLCSTDNCSEAELADHMVRLLNNEYAQTVTLPSIAASGDDRTTLPVNAKINAARITNCFGIQLPTWRKNFKFNYKAWLKDCGEYKELLETFENKKQLKI